MMIQDNSIVKLDDVENKLKEIFSKNPSFEPSRIKEENTFEYNVESFVLKITTGPYKDLFKSNGNLLNNFYSRLETFKLENLSRYSNEGYVAYDSIENIGKINTHVLEIDDAQSININNIFSQLMIMVATSKENYYGFGNIASLKALNEACTYMIASNISSHSENNLLEEEYNCLQKLNLTLQANDSHVDILKAYITNDGENLASELYKTGISSDILEQLNYINQAKKSNINIVGMYPKIDNEINKNFAKVVSNKTVSKDLISSYESSMLKDGVLNSSTVGMSAVTDNMKQAIDYMKQQNTDNTLKNQVMQRVV